MHRREVDMSVGVWSWWRSPPSHWSRRRATGRPTAEAPDIPDSMHSTPRSPRRACRPWSRRSPARHLGCPLRPLRPTAFSKSRRPPSFWRSPRRATPSARARPRRANRCGLRRSQATPEVARSACGLSQRGGWKLNQLTSSTTNTEMTSGRSISHRQLRRYRCDPDPTLAAPASVTPPDVAASVPPLILSAQITTNCSSPR